MLFVLKMTYLIMASTWQVLARLADIHQPVLLGLAKLADIRQPVLLGLAKLAEICQRPFLRKM
jgi:hypothetical protein